MSDEAKIQKIKAAKPGPSGKSQKPPRNDELTNESLDKVTGGLLPAVGPEK